MEFVTNEKVFINESEPSTFLTRYTQQTEITKLNMTRGDDGRIKIYTEYTDTNLYTTIATFITKYNHYFVIKRDYASTYCAPNYNIYNKYSKDFKQYPYNENINVQSRVEIMSALFFIIDEFSKTHPMSPEDIDLVVKWTDL